jgi:hypothetical protein
MIHRTHEPTAETYREAQIILDRHVTSLATGRCIDCDALGPCYRREAAVSIMARYLWLPLRKPGASRPELIGARRVG